MGDVITSDKPFDSKGFSLPSSKRRLEHLRDGVRERLKALSNLSLDSKSASHLLRKIDELRALSLNVRKQVPNVITDWQVNPSWAKWFRVYLLSREQLRSASCLQKVELVSIKECKLLCDELTLLLGRTNHLDDLFTAYLTCFNTNRFVEPCLSDQALQKLSEFSSGLSKALKTINREANNQRLLAISASPSTIFDPFDPNSFKPSAAMAKFFSIIDDHLPEIISSYQDLEVAILDRIEHLDSQTITATNSPIGTNLLSQQIAPVAVLGFMPSKLDCESEAMPPSQICTSPGTTNDPLSIDDAAELVAVTTKRLYNKKAESPPLVWFENGLCSYSALRPWLITNWPKRSAYLPESYQEAKKHFLK